MDSSLSTLDNCNNNENDRSSSSSGDNNKKNANNNATGAVARMEDDMNDDSENMWTTLRSKCEAANTTSNNNATAQAICTHLYHLEKELRCTICGEFMKIPVILKQCHHTFCSECIRNFFKSSLKSMKRKATCPYGCKEATYSNSNEIEKSLVPNRALQSLLQIYDNCSTTQSDENRLRSNEGLRTLLKQNLLTTIVHSDNSKSNIENDNCTSNSTNDTTESVARQHQDQPQNEAQQRTSPRTQLQPQKQEAPTKNPPKQPKTFMNKNNANLKKRSSVSYHGLKKKQLQELCQKDFLDTTGTEQQLKDRHQSFLILYNSEMDGTNPRSAREIAKEIRQREKNRSREMNAPAVQQQSKCVEKLFSQRQQTNSAFALSSGNQQFDQQLQTNFKNLIAQAKAKKATGSKKRKWTEGGDGGQAANEEEKQKDSDNCEGENNSSNISTNSSNGSPSASAPVAAPTATATSINPHKNNGSSSKKVSAITSPTTTIPTSKVTDNPYAKKKVRSNPGKEASAASTAVTNNSAMATAVANNVTRKATTTAVTKNPNNNNATKAAIAVETIHIIDCDADRDDDNNSKNKSQNPTTNPRRSSANKNARMLRTSGRCGGSWQCSRCTLINEKRTYITATCEACGQPRKQSSF